MISLSPKLNTRKLVLITVCCMCLLSALPGKAQVKDFSPAVQDDNYLTGLSDKYLHQYKERLDKLPSKNKKDLVEAYQRRWENIFPRMMPRNMQRPNTWGLRTA